MPDWLIGPSVFLAVLIGMEGVAWALHKYVMHGPLWVLHESHHRPRQSWFELNDLFGLFFTAISIGLALAGTVYYSPLLWAGMGMAAYGLIYFLIHDVLVHRRVEHGFVPRSGYLRRVYQAHRLHHAAHGRDGAVSFGFVYSPRPEKLAAKLKSKAAEAIVAEDGPAR
jgi:beta-carotene 3-hydroxylase